jgi:apolipoprotein D and lipocalin family protein
MGATFSSTGGLPALQLVAKCDTARVMDTWFVIGVKPTFLETTCSNAVEKYTLMEEGGNSKFDINIDFQYNQKDPITSPLKSLPQKGWVQGDRANSGLWKVSPFWPVKMPFPIIEIDDKDYSYVVIGSPNRAYCWIMGRKPIMTDALYDSLAKKLVENHQYPADESGKPQGLRKVPQKWTSDERTKRGFTIEEIPDDMLAKE